MKELPEGTADLIVGVKEAAEVVGVAKSNFVRDHANKSDFPPPIAELASERLWLRSDIERYVQRKATPGRRRSRASKSPSSPR